MGVPETLSSVEGAARVRKQVVGGEPVAMALTEISRHAPQLVVIGKPDPRMHHVERGMMGAVWGFELPAMHRPT